MRNGPPPWLHPQRQELQKFKVEKPGPDLKLDGPGLGVSTRSDWTRLESTHAWHLPQLNRRVLIRKYPIKSISAPILLMIFVQEEAAAIHWYIKQGGLKDA